MIVIICEKMGWDYFTYLNQPDWFIELVKVNIKYAKK